MRDQVQLLKKIRESYQEKYVKYKACNYMIKGMRNETNFAHKQFDTVIGVRDSQDTGDESRTKMERVDRSSRFDGTASVNIEALKALK